MQIFKSTVTSTSLNQTVSTVLTAFTTTISKLQEVVDSANEQAIVKQQEIEAASIEKAELESIAAKNLKIINNLNAIIA